MKTCDASGLSEAALKAGVDWLTKRHASPFTANADFASVTADGKVNACINHACHGGMVGAGYELIATVSCWATYRYRTYVMSYAKDGYTDTLPTAIGERFYDWFVNRSWAADYIVAPDQGYATYTGFMVSTDIPSNYVLAIMTMSRNAQEQAHNVQRMYDYVDEFGISEDLAYFLAFGVATGNKYGTILSGHNLFYQQGAAALDFWMRRDIQCTNETFRSGANTGGVNAMWGPSDKNWVDSYEQFKDKVEMGSVVIPNPFKPVVKRNQMTEEFLRSIIPNIAARYAAQEEVKKAA